MSKEDENKTSQITNIYISDSVINRSVVGNKNEDSKVEPKEESSMDKAPKINFPKISAPQINLADKLSVWFSNSAPSDKLLHTRLAFLMSFLFLYTALAVEKSRTWFSLDLPLFLYYSPFDSPISANIFILLSIFSFSYIGYLYRDNLFNTNLNVVITLVCFYIIFKFIEGTMNFIFFSANWDVIWVNRRMIAVGPYFTSHGEEIARLWPTVYMMAVLLGCGYGSLGEKQHKFLIPFTFFAFCLVIGATYNIRPEGNNSGHYDYTLTLQRLLFTIFLTYISFLLSHKYYKNAEEYQINLFHQILSAAAVLAFILTLYFLDRSVDGDDGVPPGEWGGLFLNFILAAAAIVLGFGIGIILAFGRRSPLPLFSWPSTAIIETVRSGPLVAWLFIAYILMPDVIMPVWDADRVSRTILILSLFSGCYLAEILRGGLQAVPSGQKEAALSLGLSTTQTNMLIVLPQAVRITMPAIVSNMIGLWKDTSLIHLLGIHDAFQVAKVLPAQWEFVGLYPEALLFVGMIFWIVSFYLSKISQRIEKNLGLKSEGGGEMT